MNIPKTKKALVLIALGATGLSGCAGTDFSEGVMRQAVKFRSDQPGATCDVYRLNKKNWKTIPAASAHRKEVALAITNTKAWKRGISLETVPTGSVIVADDLLLPASLNIERSTDFLVAECQAQGGKTVTRAFAHRGNPDATVASIVDPTFVGVDLVAAETGFAYLYPSEINVRFE